MKIAVILEIANKRTKGEWVFHPEVLSKESCSYGLPHIEKRAYVTIPESFDSSGDDNIDNVQVRNNYDAQYIAIAPEMESKLRVMQQLMPEIKKAIELILSIAEDQATAGYVFREAEKTSTAAMVKWKMQDLLKSLEGWENE